MKPKYFTLPALLLLAISAFAYEYMQSIYIDKKYKISVKLEESEVWPQIWDEDSVLIRTAYPVFKIDGNELYLYDILVGEKAVEWAENFHNGSFKNTKIDYAAHPEAVGMITDFWYDWLVKDQGLGDASVDLFYEPLHKWAPHGFVNSWGWKRGALDYAYPWVDFYNSSSKTIKYITFYIAYDNAVGDPIRNYLEGGTLFQYQGIGPVVPGELGSWDWYNDGPPYSIKNADYGRLKKIVIEYMDGSKYTLIKELKFNEAPRIP